MKVLSSGLCLLGFVGACAPDASNTAKEQKVAGRENAVVTHPRDASSQTPPSNVKLTDTPSLKRVDDLSVYELRKFLAGKRLEPPGLVAGSEAFEADGSWHAFVEAIMATSHEGFWEIRSGPEEKPELCTTEYKRDGKPLSAPETACRTISVSLHENRAELNDARFPERKYVATISRIEK